MKPCLKKRARSQTQAIQDKAKTFSAFGEQQQQRSETMVEAEKERQDEFFKFQREQAELNHELKMVRDYNEVCESPKTCPLWINPSGPTGAKTHKSRLL